MNNSLEQKSIKQTKMLQKILRKLLDIGRKLSIKMPHYMKVKVLTPEIPTFAFFNSILRRIYNGIQGINVPISDNDTTDTVQCPQQKSVYKQLESLLQFSQNKHKILIQKHQKFVKQTRFVESESKWQKSINIQLNDQISKLKVKIIEKKKQILNLKYQTKNFQRIIKDLKVTEKSKSQTKNEVSHHISSNSSPKGNDLSKEINKVNITTQGQLSTSQIIKRKESKEKIIDGSYRYKKNKEALLSLTSRSQTKQYPTTQRHISSDSALKNINYAEHSNRMSIHEKENVNVIDQLQDGLPMLPKIK